MVVPIYRFWTISEFRKANVPHRNWLNPQVKLFMHYSMNKSTKMPSVNNVHSRTKYVL